MQDEHFMKLWCESRGMFAPDRASRSAPPAGLAISTDSPMVHCRERLAMLLGLAIPGGFAAGVLAAAIAAAATMPIPEPLASPAPEPIASYVLPYPA